MAKQSGVIRQDLSKELVRGKQAAFQYKPVVSQDLSWLARSQNQRNYLESERKRKEQEGLRDQLTKIQQLGLPKEMQGYLNNSVDELIEQVRAGEIDPQSYDFRSKIAGIGGEAAQLNNINENLKTLVAEDKQVILGDEDVSTDYKNKYIAGYNTDFVPGTDIMGKYSGVQAALQRGTEAIKFDETAANSIVNDWISRNENKIAEISKLKQKGFSGYNLISELSQIPGVDISELEGYLNTKSDVYLRSEYARDKKAARSAGIPIESYEDYKADRLGVFIPKQERITEQKIGADEYAKEQFKESLKDKPSVVATAADYQLTLPKIYADADGNIAFATKATTLSLSKPVNIDFVDPEAKESEQERVGEPVKINRLFALDEGKTGKDQRYVVEFNAYQKDLQMSQDAFEELDNTDKLLYKISSDGQYYKLDEARPLYKFIKEDDLTWNAIQSGIAKESKATGQDLVARIESIRVKVPRKKGENSTGSEYITPDGANVTGIEDITEAELQGLIESGAIKLKSK